MSHSVEPVDNFELHALILVIRLDVGNVKIGNIRFGNAEIGRME